MYKLIIVDDDAGTSNHLGNYFPWEENGFTVVDKFYDGYSAYEYLINHKVDIILCDINMPIMNGIELAKKIRELNRDEIIVFISGYKDFDYAQKAIEYGVSYYCLKPITYKYLKIKLEKIKIKLDEIAARKQDKNSESSPVGIQNIRINKIKDYINTNFKNATLTTIADFMSMNQSYLSRFFKKNTNENISCYITKVRMKKAITFLQDETYKNIYDISELVGYGNPVSFSKTFCKYYGVSPAQYRRNFMVTN